MQSISTILITVVFIIVTNLNFAFGALCRLSKGHKNYTCVGFPLRQLSAGPRIRQEILRMDITDCKEITINEEALKFPNVEYLKLSCGIANIHVNSVRNLAHLKELDLGNNSFSSLPDNVFQALSKLKKLNLSYNGLEELSKNVFSGLNNLKELHISNNLISKFDIKTLDAVKDLEALHLNKNKINVVPSRLFNKLRSLRVVDLSHNEIEDLGNLFLFAYKLEYLNLSYNVIEEISDQLFQSTNLKILDLSNNKLSIFYEGSVRLNILEDLHLQGNRISLFEVNGMGMNRIPLKYLNLKNNRLVFLENNFVKIAKSLVTFEIEGNPWDCNCYDKIEIERGDLSIQTSSAYTDGELPLCVTSQTNDNNCNVDKNNLECYYNVYQRQINS